MSRLRRALDAGWDPAALTEQYNAAAAEKRSADAELASIDVPSRLTTGDVRAMIGRLGDVAQILDNADQCDLAALYAGLHLAVSYDHRTRSADVSISPESHGFSVGVRGGT